MPGSRGTVCNLRTSYKAMETANSLEQQTEDLIKILTRLNEQNKIKPRDWHEVEVLIDVARGNDVAEVLRREANANLYRHNKVVERGAGI